MATTSPLRVGIYGPEENCTSGARGCTLWPLGYAAMVQAAGAVPVPLGSPQPKKSVCATGPVRMGCPCSPWTRRCMPSTRSTAARFTWT